MSFGGEYAFFKEDSACSTFGDSDTVIFSKEFGKMTDIRIKILVFIKQGYLLSDVVRSGMGRDLPLLPWEKAAFPRSRYALMSRSTVRLVHPSSIAALSLLPLVSTSS